MVSPVYVVVWSAAEEERERTEKTGDRRGHTAPPGQRHFIRLPSWQERNVSDFWVGKVREQDMGKGFRV